jgi:hypothetical protein
MDPLILCSAIVAAQKIVATAAHVFDYIPTQHEVGVEKKRGQEADPYKHNISICLGLPKTALELYMFWTVFLSMTIGDTSRKSLTLTCGSSFFLLNA